MSACNCVSMVADSIGHNLACRNTAPGAVPACSPVRISQAGTIQSIAFVASTMFANPCEVCASVTITACCRELCSNEPCRAPDVCIEAAGFHYAKSWLHTIEMTLQLETDSGDMLNEMIVACRKGGRISIVGVYAGFVNHFNIGTSRSPGTTSLVRLSNAVLAGSSLVCSDFPRYSRALKWQRWSRPSLGQAQLLHGLVYRRRL